MTESRDNSEVQFQEFKDKFARLIQSVEADTDSASLKLEIGKLGDEISSSYLDLRNQIRTLQEENTELKSAINKGIEAIEQASVFLKDFFTARKLIKAIHSTYNIDSFCSVFVETLTQYIPLKQFGVYLIEENVPVPIYPENISIAFNEAVINEWDEGVIDWIIKGDHPVIIDDMNIPLGQSAEAVFIAPMVISGQTLGFIKAKTSKLKAEFNQYEIDIISFLVSQASLALLNIRLIVDLTSTRDFLQNLMDNADDLIVAYDASGRILFINKAVEKYNFSREKLLDESLVKLLASGTKLEHLLSLKKFPSQEEIEITCLDGRTAHTICTISAVADFEGNFKEFLAVFKDITSRYYQEGKRLAMERLAVVAETAIAINHELNNPLTIIMGQLYLAKDQARKLEAIDLVNRIDSIDKNFRRVINILKKLQNIQQITSKEYLEELKMIDLNS